ncbi:hypothetical protein OUZ56_022780 [Daphnia magna]|uniref:Uncharacterized protein n=1 Tax=Daphnia magna TaxID=35525 RepID=A0ABR0AXK6_9CRUS|nr:hypothetical protein OUZ56_022780 [Daphnia magna]
MIKDGRPNKIAHSLHEQSLCNTRVPSVALASDNWKHPIRMDTQKELALKTDPIVRRCESCRLVARSRHIRYACLPSLSAPSITHLTNGHDHPSSCPSIVT